MEFYKYNTSQFNFYKLISSTFDVSNLSKLHLSDEFRYDTQFVRETDQSTHWHRKFYELSRTDEFISMYFSFINDIIKPLYSGEIVYQTIPTFRIQFPNNIAVGEYHRDRDYRDGDWASKVRELNFFLPITSAKNTNTIWVESSEDEGDYSPIEAEYGQLVRWDGSNLKHGNVQSIEKTTRISMDFRVIDFNNYIPSTKGSINLGTKFEIGGYYSKL